MQKSLSRLDINWSVFALAVGLGLSACGGEAPEGSADHVASGAQEIVNGTAVNPLGSGIVYVMLPTGSACSGVLMRNRAVMTAAHCVSPYVNSPGQVTAFMHPWASAADGIWTHPSKDVAILRLAFAFPMYGPNESRPIYTGSDASLHNRSLTLAGYGWSTGCTGMNPFSLRKASVAGEDDPYFGQVIVRPNGLGQVGHEGDSGAPLLDGTSLTHAPLAGIQTECSGWACPDDPPNLCYYDSAEGWLLWAFLILYNIPQ
jgi:hypothetical protein